MAARKYPLVNREYPFSSKRLPFKKLSGDIDDSEITLAIGYLRRVAKISWSDIKERACLTMGDSAYRRHSRIASYLHPRAWALYRSGNLSIGHAYALCRVKDQSTQDKAVQACLNRSMTVRRLENYIRGNRPKITREGKEREPAASKETPEETLDIEDEHTQQYRQLEAKIAQQIGSPCRIVRDGSINSSHAGYIQFQYYGLDAFDGILNRLGLRVSEDDFE